MKKTFLIFALAASLLLSASCAAGAPPSVTAPVTSADPAPDTAAQTAPDTEADTAPQTASDTAPQTAPGTAPAADTAAQTSAETDPAPETTAPETAPAETTPAETTKTDEGELPMATVFTNPVAPGADPFVLKDDDGTYYLYVTADDDYGYRVYSSRNLVEWTAHGFCLLRGDVYTDPNSKYGYRFWAPEVMKYNGKYYMVYTAQHRIGIAVADRPTGPFRTGTKEYLINSCNVIDGSFFTDDDGKVYLYFVTQGAATLGSSSVKKGNNIWGCEFNMDTLTIRSGSIKLLVSPTPTIELESKNGGDCCEGPFMIKHGGVYYLTFSSNRYYSTKYSVQYATGSSPLGFFKRGAKNVTLMCDDLDYKDNRNPHLYGTGHHSFVEAPNGRDIVIVYHAHRTGISDQFVGTGTATVSSNPLCSPRNVCVDLAWFTEDGKLQAGMKDKPTVPTAVAQPFFEGAASERKTHYTGAFAAIPELPVVYLSQMDGKDTNSGEKNSPVQTLAKAVSKLAKGGTVVLVNGYESKDAVLSVPHCSGPLLITAEHNNVVLSFKFIRLNGDVYFDNIIFAPVTLNEVSVIECNFHNVVMGEGVSCLNRRLHPDYPYLIGGKWKYAGASGDAVYKNNFNAAESALVSTASYGISVYGGTWQSVSAGSMRTYAPIEGSAENAQLTVGEGARVIG